MSVSRHYSGGWLISIDVAAHLRTDPDVRERVTRVVQGTKREAQLVESQMRVEINGRDTRAPDVLTMSELAGRYLAQAKESREHNTWKAHESNWRIHLEPAFGRVLITDLHPAQVDDLTRRLQAEHSRRLASSVLTTLSAILRLAVRYEWLPTHPLRDRVTWPTPAHTTRPLPTDEQLGRLWEIVGPDVFWLAWFRLMYATGARPGEVGALRWSDIETDGDGGGVMVISGALKPNPDGPGHVRGTTKTRKERVVALDVRTVEILEDLQGVGLSGLWVFPAPRDRDRPMSPTTSSVKWQRLREAAGIDPATRQYELRHRAATVLIAAGVTATDVADHLGNSAAIVQRTYAHATRGRGRGLVDTIVTDRSSSEANGE